MNVDNLISVATIVHNNSDIVKSYVEETIDVLKNSFTNYELVILDNGSSDGSVDRIKDLLSEIGNIRLITLSKEYDDEITYMAALENCIGDFVVLLDINFDPPSLIPQLIEKCISGYDIVVAQRIDKAEYTFLEKFFSNAFYKTSKFLTGYNINPNLSNYLSFSRRVINSIIKIRDKTRYLKYLTVEVGYSHSSLPYNRINRSGDRRKRNNLFKSFGFAIEIIVSNSDRLIRIASLIGLFASLFNLLYVLYAFGFYILSIYVFKSKVTPGWTSTSMFYSIMFFLLFLILAIIGEYLARILRETKERDLYYISDEFNSSVFPKNINRKNII